MDILAVIADPVRRDILTLLRDRPMSAGELASRFEISRPGVSRHLRVLREAGLVVGEAEGRRRVYRLDPTPLAEVQSWLSRLQVGWVESLDALETEVYRARRERRAAQSQPKRKLA